MLGVNVNGVCYWIGIDDITIVYGSDKDRRDDIDVLKSMPDKEGFSYYRSYPKDKECIANEKVKEFCEKEFEDLNVSSVTWEKQNPGV